jgi:hypothetical protein
MVVAPVKCVVMQLHLGEEFCLHSQVDIDISNSVMHICAQRMDDVLFTE